MNIEYTVQCTYLPTVYEYSKKYYLKLLNSKNKMGRLTKSAMYTVCTVHILYRKVYTMYRYILPILQNKNKCMHETFFFVFL